ncbi:MAG: HPF/RaiA family ribosome-associated protein [Patescibacteria group bacterium]
MNTTVKWTNATANAQVESYLDERMKAVEKLIDESESEALCRVELAHESSKHGESWRAEITLSAGGQKFRVEQSDTTINAAIDAVKDEIMRQLRTGKNKRMSAVRKGGAAIKKMLRR